MSLRVGGTPYGGLGQIRRMDCHAGVKYASGRRGFHLSQIAGQSTRFDEFLQS